MHLLCVYLFGNLCYNKIDFCELMGRYPEFGLEDFDEEKNRLYFCYFKCNNIWLYAANGKNDICRRREFFYTCVFKEFLGITMPCGACLF